jgi:hypothetical protein
MVTGGINSSLSILARDICSEASDSLACSLSDQNFSVAIQRRTCVCFRLKV